MTGIAKIVAIGAVSMVSAAIARADGVIDFNSGQADTAFLDPTYQPVAGTTITYGNVTVYGTTPGDPADHTATSDNAFGYAQTDEGTATFTFSNDVSIPSLYFETFHNTGDQAVIHAYDSLGNELTPGGLTVSEVGGTWTQVTGLSSFTNLRAFTITNNTIAGSDAINFDDINVVVPEPASLSLLGLGGLGLLARRRRQA